MIELSLALLAVPVFWAFAEWRFGLLACLVTAIFQDPLRKLAPDQPVFFVVFVGVVFAAACVGALVRGVPLNPTDIFEPNRRIKFLMWLLLLLIILQAINSFTHFGNPMITLVGLLTYLLPLPSIVFAYQLVVRAGEAPIHQFMRTYLVLITIALTTVYLEYSGYDWPVFGQVGGNLIIYDEYMNGILVPHSGIFRASEIAAWHAMTCACFIMMLLTMRTINFWTLSSAAILVGVLLGIGSLNGPPQDRHGGSGIRKYLLHTVACFQEGSGKTWNCANNCRCHRIWLVVFWIGRSARFHGPGLIGLFSLCCTSQNRLSGRAGTLCRAWHSANYLGL